MYEIRHFFSFDIPLILDFIMAVDAAISFPSGLSISWANKSLGTIQMPDINITGDVGANFSVDTTFSVVDVDHLTDFTKVRFSSYFGMSISLSRVFRS